MNFKKSLLYAALLPLIGFSVLSKAEVIAIESLNGITHQFPAFDSLEKSAGALADNSSLSFFYNPVNRTGQVTQITDNSNNTSFTIMRPFWNTYVIAQPKSDGSTSITTIHKENGGVQAELENYLTGHSTAYAKAGIDAVTLAQVNTLIANVNLSKADSTVTTSAKTNFVNTLTTEFAKPTNPVPNTPVPPSPFGDALANTAKNRVNAYLKNGMLQGNPASYIAQMAYYDQTLDLGGVASSHFDHSADSAQNKSRMAIKARLSNYSFSSQNVQVYTVTPSYTHELGKAWALLIDLPMSYVSRTGNSSYNVSMGAGLRVPVLRYDSFGWDLIALGRIGGVNLDCVNSTNLNCADSSFVYSGGIQSNLGFNFGAGYSLLLQDQYTSQSVEALVTNVNVNVYNLNTLLNVTNGTVDVYRNGAQLLKETNYNLLGRKVSASLNFADTRFGSSYGSFIDSQQEYGFNVSLRGAPHASIAQDFKIGINYTTAKNMSDAIAGTIGVTF